MFIYIYIYYYHHLGEVLGTNAITLLITDTSQKRSCHMTCSHQSNGAVHTHLSFLWQYVSVGDELALRAGALS